MGLKGWREVKETLREKMGNWNGVAGVAGYLEGESCKPRVRERPELSASTLFALSQWTMKRCPRNAGPQIEWRHDRKRFQDVDFFAKLLQEVTRERILKYPPAPVLPQASVDRRKGSLIQGYAWWRRHHCNMVRNDTTIGDPICCVKTNHDYAAESTRGREIWPSRQSHCAANS